MDWLPTTVKEMEKLGWERPDVVLFTGDAYVDHPSFGTAVIARVLQSEGYRVAVVPQPNWQDDLRDFRKFGAPRLFFGVSAGNMDSMVNHYTANIRLRSDDAYTAGGRAGQRPDYAATVYTRILKQLYPDVPVILGGIEASLRRLTHYDYWTDSLKPSILADSGADLLVYGMGEKAMVEVARTLEGGFIPARLRTLRQIAYVLGPEERISAVRPAGCGYATALGDGTAGGDPIVPGAAGEKPASYSADVDPFGRHAWLPRAGNPIAAAEDPSFVPAPDPDTALPSCADNTSPDPLDTAVPGRDRAPEDCLLGQSAAAEDPSFVPAPDPDTALPSCVDNTSPDPLDTAVPGRDRASEDCLPGQSAAAEIITLGSYERCVSDKKVFADNFVRIETESNKLHQNAVLVEPFAEGCVVVNPPHPLLSESEMDRIYALPYNRLPHPRYAGKGPIAAYEMIKDSITIHRGCFGGCSFCTISAHQGKFIASRSVESVLQELRRIASMPGFKGNISDIGGPSANMYRMKGKDMDKCSACRRPSCAFPAICPNLDNDHGPLIELYDKVRSVPGINKAYIGSGIRYDLFDRKNGLRYLRNVVVNHTSGRLKVAPEHTEDNVLKMMRKPSFGLFERLHADFRSICTEEALRYQLIPYFISSHPGCREQDMKRLAERTRRLDLRLEQVQDLTPTPMTLSSVMFYTGFDPYTGRAVFVARDQDSKKRQKSYFFGDPPKESRGRPRGSDRSGRDQDYNRAKQGPTLRNRSRNGPGRRRR